MTDHENELRNACAGLLRVLNRVMSADAVQHLPEVAKARAAIGKLELRGLPPTGPSGRLFRAHGDGALSSEHVIWLKPGEIF